MSGDWLFYLFYTVIAIVIQGVFSAFEMACVSFNKVRLQYYVSMGNKRAIWLNYLLQKPSRLFGTCLIGGNTAMLIGSECARRFYESLHLDPDWAPLTQVFIVVMFAELVPFFMAMRHPEQPAMLLVPVITALTKLFAPIIWMFDILSHFVHRMLGQSRDVPLFLSREEVKIAFEEKKKDEFNQTVAEIFQLKSLTAGQLMTPLDRSQIVSSTAMLADVRHLLSIHYLPFMAVYHRVPHNIVGLVNLRDLLRMKEDGRIIECIRSPWFVVQEASILSILDQFRRNNQSVAVILDASGRACGLLTLDDILAQIFGSEAPHSASNELPSLFVERTLSGEMSVAAFNQEFQANLPFKPGDTLSNFILQRLDHLPTKGETINIDPYLFTVIEPTFRGVKIFSVRTFIE